MSDRTETFAKQLRKHQTDVEKLLWSKLQNRQIEGVKFRRQESIRGYIVDFVCFEKKIIIELDGGQHNSTDGKTYDINRSHLLEAGGFKVLRYWNSEIMENIEGVIEQISSVVLNTEPSSRPSPRREKKIKEGKR
jgi:very-short-patch-repair endonuclease